MFDIFYVNKNYRALNLEQEFSSTHVEQFSNASSYCQHLKFLSDQLYNVGDSVSNARLVLQLISGLTDAYATTSSQIRHNDSLLPFYKACSMILLEEASREKKTANTPDNTTFIASHTDASTPTPSNRTNHDGGNTNRGKGGNGRDSRGRGRNNGRSAGRSQPPQWTLPSYPHQHQQWIYPSYPNQNQEWNFPMWQQPCSTISCSYPTTGNSNK